MSGRRDRVLAFVAAVLVAAVATLFGAQSPASAAPTVLAKAPTDLCTTAEWQKPGQLPELCRQAQDRSRHPGRVPRSRRHRAPRTRAWRAGSPSARRRPKQPGPQGFYSDYGYAGYDFSTYDLKCASTVTHPGRHVRKYGSQWRVHARDIDHRRVQRAPRAGVGSRATCGAGPTRLSTRPPRRSTRRSSRSSAHHARRRRLYLLWRSRQSDMSNAVTTAGWAILVMVVVTAIAAVADLVGRRRRQDADQQPRRHPQRRRSARPDASRRTSAVIPTPTPASITGRRRFGRATPRPRACSTETGYAASSARPTATRRSSTARRSTTRSRSLGTRSRRSAKTRSASATAPAVHDAPASQRRRPTLDEGRGDRSRPRTLRPTSTCRAPTAWTGSAPGFIAILASLFFAMFDITASLLVLLGFLIFRWAVIAAPILGTLGLLRPASSGLRRLANAVVAAIFNIIIFGTGSAIYLFAVNLILSTASLAGLAAGRSDLADRRGRLAAAAPVPPDHPARRQGLDRGRRLGRPLAPVVHARRSRRRRCSRSPRPAAPANRAEGAAPRWPRHGSGRSRAPRTPSWPARSPRPASLRSPPRPPVPSRHREEARATQRGGRTASWEAPDLYGEPAPSYTIYRPDSDRARPDRRPVRRPESVRQPG